MNGRQQLVTVKKDMTVHIVQAEWFYKDLTIWEPLIRTLHQNGTQQKTENCRLLWLVMEVIGRFGGNAPRDMSGRQQLEIVRGVLAVHIVQGIK